MKIQPALAALSMSVVIALGAGCAQDRDDADTVVVDPAPAVVATDPVIDPAIGADPAVAGVATGQRGDFASWDTNADGMLDDTEFRTRFGNGTWYDGWDGDRNGSLTSAEFGTVNTTWGTAPDGVDATGLFDTWDANRDGMIATDEAAAGAFGTWDRDGNKTIDRTEFDAGVNWFGR